MSENVKSGIVLSAALLLGGLLVAGLVQQVELGRGKEKAPEVNATAQFPAQPAAQPAASPITRPRVGPETAKNDAKTLPATPPEPAPPQHEAAVAPEANSADAPTVDFFGKPLDAFSRQVNERVGIAGQVVMGDRPVPGATVVLRRVSRKIADGAPDYTGVDADPPGGQEWTAVTDSEGKYAFYGLDEGHFGLEAHTDSACGVEDMTIRGGSISGRLPGKPAYFAARGKLAIELWPSGVLSGRVLTPEGQPVAGATVYPYKMQSPTGTMTVEPIPQVFLSVQTDADGAFRFPRLSAGRWQLAVRAAAYSDQKTDWLATGEQPAEIHMNPPGSVVQTGTRMLDSAEFNLSDYKGKCVLLDFWAVWCGPCRGETPNVKAVYEEFKDNPRFALVGMDLDPNPEDAKKYISDNGMEWTHVLLGDWSKSAIAKQYQVEAIPCLILVDPDGKELARDLRGPAVGEAVRRALGTPEERDGAEQPRPAAAVTPVAVNAPAPETAAPAAAPTDNGTSDGVLKLNLDLGFDYRSEGFPMGLAAGQSDAEPTSTRPCKTLSAEPAYHSKPVYYGYMRLGNAEDNRFVFVVDDIETPTWVGYFDRNNNGDLTDDGPSVIISQNVEFDVAVVLSNGKTVHRPYKIWQWGNSEAGKPGLRFYSVCHYEAKLHINGKIITAVAFEQYNHDGLYHDDGIWLDLNGDNRMDEKMELFKDGSTVTVNGRSLLVKLDYP